MWRRKARRRFTLPFAVILKRFAAARLVFSFGIASSFLLRDQHHRHAAAFHARLLLDGRDVAELVRDAVEHRLPELGMRDRAATEEDRDLHPVSVAEEVADVADLEVDVVGTRLGTDLHFLQDRRRGLLPRLLRLLLLRVPKLPVVHDPADRRVRGGCHLDEIEVALLRDAHRVLRRHDAELRAVGVDDADLARADVRVDPGLVFDLGYAAPPGTRASAAVRATNSASGTASCPGVALRGATVPAAASRSPTTAMTGTFASCASRTL